VQTKIAAFGPVFSPRKWQSYGQQFVGFLSDVRKPRVQAATAVTLVEGRRT